MSECFSRVKLFKVPSRRNTMLFSTLSSLKTRSKWDTRESDLDSWSIRDTPTKSSPNWLEWMMYKLKNIAQVYVSIIVIIIILFSQEPLSYRSREEQGQLLQQVLAASDMDADEERMPGDSGLRAGPSVRHFVLSISFIGCAKLVEFFNSVPAQTRKYVLALWWR